MCIDARYDGAILATKQGTSTGYAVADNCDITPGDTAKHGSADTISTDEDSADDDSADGGIVKQCEG